jgi:hypothetical protein
MSKQLWADWGGLIFGVLCVVGPGILLQMHNSALMREYERNNQVDAPDNQQIHWHIRHIREDISLLCKVNMLGFSVLAGILLWK